jgi:thioredoxin reductase
MTYDIAIVGGGPAGLAAALTLGRARKRVLLLDAGPRRNAAATHVHNFVTRDGTPPQEFRRIGREQLVAYPNVEVRDTHVDEIRGERGAFEVRTAGTVVAARRILLCTGMIDEVPTIEGMRAIWGTSAILCPYCHGWEVQDRRFAYLATVPERLEFPLLLRGWSSDVSVFTGGTVAVPPEVRAKLSTAGIPIEERPIARLLTEGAQLLGIELGDGTKVARDVLFVHPPQRQVDVVRALGLALDDAGFVKTDPMMRTTSIPGIYAGGDLMMGMQSAIGAAAAGVHAAAVLNHELTVERALQGATPPA